MTVLYCKLYDEAWKAIGVLVKSYRYSYVVCVIDNLIAN